MLYLCHAERQGGWLQGRCVLRSGNNTNANNGLVNCNANNDSATSNSNVGARLTSKIHLLIEADRKSFLYHGDESSTARVRSLSLGKSSSFLLKEKNWKAET